MTNEEILEKIKPVILEKLKCPASANFSPELINISKIKNKEYDYHIEGFVDAQNVYGAMIRNDFTLEVKIINQYLKVQSCKVGIKTTTQQVEGFGKNYAVAIIFVIIGSAVLYFFNKIW